MEETRFIGKDLKKKRTETILHLRDILGLKFRQIAPQVRLKESAVKTNYHNAKKGVTNWIKTRCSVCGRVYEYPECEYKPKTCSTFECVQKYHRDPGKYKKEEK